MATEQKVIRPNIGIPIPMIVEDMAKNGWRFFRQKSFGPGIAPELYFYRDSEEVPAEIKVEEKVEQPEIPADVGGVKGVNTPAKRLIITDPDLCPEGIEFASKSKAKKHFGKSDAWINKRATYLD